MTTSTRPHRVRASELQARWHVMDADGKTLGRFSSEIAVLLQGKHKPDYVPYLNSGDYVIVVNAEKVRVTGKKLEQKVYYRHSGYHGGLKARTLSEVLEKAPTNAIRQAVKGMLPKNTVGRRMLSRLKLYVGASHPHEAQVNARPKVAKAELPTQPSPETVPAEKKPKRTPRSAPAATTEPAGVSTTEAPRPSEAGQEDKPQRTRRKAPAATTEPAGVSTTEAPAPSEVGQEEKPKRRRAPAARAKSTAGRAAAEADTSDSAEEKEKPKPSKARSTKRGSAGASEGSDTQEG